MDFTLWISRVEMYFEEAGIPTEKQARELLALLDDSSFRVAKQLGLLQEDYLGLKSALGQHFAPQGNSLEYQYQLQNRYQKENESLSEFAGDLRLLADKAYSDWKPTQRLELAIVRGVMSSSIQLALMKEQSKSFNSLVGLAQQLYTIESAQRELIKHSKLTVNVVTTNAVTTETMNMKLTELSD